MSYKIVIPARYASTRLPGKPLADIGGKPMIVRVAEQAAKTGAEVVIATDFVKVFDAAKAHGFNAVMTRINHVSGTDRIAEVALKLGWADTEIVVNVQGDEPLIDAALINEVATNLASHGEAAISTASHAIHSEADFLNPNIVKVVLDRFGYASYFSRAPIPYPRDGLSDTSPIQAMRHIGIYAYRTAFLKAYAHLTPAPTEQLESLEQLRALWHGYKISVAVTDHAPASGVDTQADLDRVREIFANLG